MGNGARACGWGRREDEEQDVLLLPWQDSMGCKTLKRRWSSVASKANQSWYCWCPACSLSPILYSCPVLAPSPGLSWAGSEMTAGEDFAESSTFLCSAHCQLHWLKCISLACCICRQEPIHPCGREQTGQGRNTGPQQMGHRWAWGLLEVPLGYPEEIMSSSFEITS